MILEHNAAYDAIGAAVGLAPMLGIVPLLAAGLAAKLLGGFLKGKGQKKQDKEQYMAQKASYEAGQARRGSRLDAIQTMLGRLHTGTGSVPGAPDYSLDPEALERMKAAIPFAQGDPTKGSTWGMAGDLSTNVGEGLLAGYQPQVAPVDFNPGQIQAQASGDIFGTEVEDPLKRRFTAPRLG